jgi:hypothetical protein
MHARRSNRESGYVLVSMAGTAFALLAAVGLAVDIGRMFIAKNETQAYCDSAAMAATLKLNGLSTGIAAATAVVASSKNSWNLDTAPITNYTVDFSTSATGPWSTNPGSPADFRFVRVQATVPVTMFFLPVVVSQQSSNVSSITIAAQIPQTTVKRGLGPYTAVSTDPASPNFGLVVGSQYDIQWPAYNGSRGGCSPATPDNCFVSPPCTGDPQASKAAITQYWGASINGYWGSNANSMIDQEVLDNVQLQPITVGAAISLSSGNKNAEAAALDTRVNEDGDVLDNTRATYLSNDTRNGRRIIELPVVNPTADGTFVIGYGAFLLLSNSDGTTPSNFYAQGNGNKPYCAIYLGPFVQGSMDAGATTSSTGSFTVGMVQ